METFTLKIDGAAVYSGLTAREVDALVRTARNFKTDPATDSGCRIDVEAESRYSSSTTDPNERTGR